MERIYFVLIVAGLGIVAMVGFFFTKKPGFGPFSLKTVGLILVATLACVVAMAPIEGHEQAGALGILGTIAGFLFGQKNDSNSE
jgi:hypothetical protein